MIKLGSLKTTYLTFFLITVSSLFFSISSNAGVVLMPLPREGFDPSEVAIPWKILKAEGHTVIFATPHGLPGLADPIMLTGKGLGLWKKILANDINGVQAYEEMTRSLEFQNPIFWNEIRFEDYDALALGGGHAKGMIEYLESTFLQDLVSRFFAENKPVAAICHGVLLVARSKHSDGKSILYDRKTTGLLKSQELLAWKMTKYWMNDYYRTYDVTVEDEVKSLLRSKSQFENGPLPFLRDTPDNLSPGFVVRDENYLSARWPGDVHLYATSFAEMLKEIGL